MKKIKYSTRIYPFKSVIKACLNVQHLTKIHEIIEYNEVFSRDKDQSSRWHQIYYKNNETFLRIYREFIKNEIKPRFNEEVVYQKIPTFRVHLPGNIAVGEWHKDKDYRDAKWAEDVNELNYYLPFTDTNKHNTFWTESVEDKGDFAPALVNYGEILEWDGANLKHGNKENKSDDTRVSVDFRVIPVSKYIPSNKGSINMESKFAIGGYYDVI